MEQGREYAPVTAVEVFADNRMHRLIPAAETEGTLGYDAVEGCWKFNVLVSPDLPDAAVDEPRMSVCMVSRFVSRNAKDFLLRGLLVHEDEQPKDVHDAIQVLDGKRLPAENLQQRDRQEHHVVSADGCRTFYAGTYEAYATWLSNPDGPR